MNGKKALFVATGGLIFAYIGYRYQERYIENARVVSGIRFYSVEETSGVYRCRGPKKTSGGICSKRFHRRKGIIKLNGVYHNVLFC